MLYFKRKMFLEMVFEYIYYLAITDFIILNLNSSLLNNFMLLQIRYNLDNRVMFLHICAWFVCCHLYILKSLILFQCFNMGYIRFYLSVKSDFTKLALRPQVTLVCGLHHFIYTDVCRKLTVPKAAEHQITNLWCGQLIMCYTIISVTHNSLCHFTQ